jgi:chromosome segregation ATPase
MTSALEQLDRCRDETMAARSALVLAETQATAARAEAGDLASQVRRLAEDLEAEQAERERASAELSEVEKQLAIIERDKAVAEARAEELRGQVEQERLERGLLSARIGALEADRELAIATMGWWSRRRWQQGRAGASPGLRQAGRGTPVRSLRGA